MQRVSLRRALVPLVATGLLGMSVSACGGPSSAEDDVFSIYMSVDLSGPIKSYSEAEIGGMQVAIDQLNENGGIQGQEVELETADDANNPTKAVSLLQKRLSEGEPPDLVFAGGSSAVTMSMLPVLTRNKIVSMSTTSASTINDPEKYPYHFGVVTSAAAYLPPMISAAKENGYDKVAMLHATDTSGQSAAANYKAAFEETDIELVQAGYDVSALDMTAELSKLKAEDPDALIISGYGTAALYAFKSRAGLGWNIPTYADQLASTFPLASSLEADQLQNVHVVMSGLSLASSPEFPALNEMVEQVKQGEHAGSLPKVGVAVYMLGYDIPMLYSEAAKKADSTDAEKVATALEELELSADAPWLQSGQNGDRTQYAYSDSTHFPTASEDSLKYVAPGTYNDDGFYVPGK